MTYVQIYSSQLQSLCSTASFRLTTGLMYQLTNLL